MKVKISATWLRLPWTTQTWDQAYQWLHRAAAEEPEAKRELAAVKLAAQAGHPQAAQVKTNLDAVALLVQRGLPKPSVFAAQRRGARRSPLVPGGGRGASPQAAVIKRQQDEIRRLKAAQIERVRRTQLHQQAQQRIAAAKAEGASAAQALEAEVEMLRRQLERRDLADDVRAQLEAQAERYEAMIDKLQTPGAVTEAATTSEAMAAEQPEAERDDAAEAVDSGAPGDVEFSNAGV